MTVTFGALLSEVGGPRSTIDHYVRLGLIPCSTDTNEYRYFKLDDSRQRVELIRTLRKRPFRYDLREIKRIFDAISVKVLIEEKNKSNSVLRIYLANQGF